MNVNILLNQSKKCLRRLQEDKNKIEQEFNNKEFEELDAMLIQLKQTQQECFSVTNTKIPHICRTIT